MTPLMSALESVLLACNDTVLGPMGRLSTGRLSLLSYGLRTVVVVVIVAAVDPPLGGLLVVYGSSVVVVCGL